MLNKNFLLQLLMGAVILMALIIPLLLGGCEGSATQTTTGQTQGLQGILVDIHGKPVPNAQVKVWPASASPNGLPNRPNDSIIGATTETDSSGRYSIKDLDVGLYNVYGEKDHGLTSVLIPRVKYVETFLDLGLDTLTTAGAIKGKVLDGNSGLNMVFCYLEGSTYVALTDTTGSFTLERIPKGIYKLNYIREGYYSEVDSIVTVQSGLTTILAPKLMVQKISVGPSAPKILTANYDSVAGVLTFTWNSVRNQNVGSYILEYFPKSHSELAASHRITGIHDTTMVSLLTRNFFGRMYHPGEDLVPLNYFNLEYSYGNEPEVTLDFWIRAVDSLGNISPNPEKPAELKIPRPQMLDNPVTLSLAEGDKDTTLCRDTLTFIVGFQKPITAIYDINWYERYQKHPAVDKMIHGGPWTSGNINQAISQNHPDTLKWSKANIWANREVHDWGNDSVSMDTGNIVVIAKLPSWKLDNSRRIDFGIDTNGCFRLHKSYRPKCQGELKFWWLSFAANGYDYVHGLCPN